MARASALHAEGQGFDSLILHPKEVQKYRRRENKKKESTKIKVKTKQTFIQFIGR